MSPKSERNDSPSNSLWNISSRRARALAAALAIALVASTLAVLGAVVPAQPAQAAGTPTGCGFATGSAGEYANTICWLDFSTYNEFQAESPFGQPYTISLPGGFTANFDLTVAPVADTTDYPYKTFRAVSTAAMAPYSAFAAQYYNTAPGSPVLWNYDGLPGDLGGGSGAVISLRNIAVTGPDGQPVTDYDFVSGDTEQTSTGEFVQFSSDKPLSLLESLSSSTFPDAGCTPANTTGIGTTTVSCTGAGDPVTHVYSNELFASSAPTIIQQTIQSSSRNAGVFGFMMSKVELNKTVASRTVSSDSFALNVASGASTLGTADTGTGNSASTGQLTDLSGSPVTLSEKADGSTLLSDYNTTWSCSLNGTLDPAVTPAAGSTSTTIPGGALPIGSFLDCTITNTAKPRQLSIQKTSDMAANAHAGDVVHYRVTATNTGTVAYTAATPAVILDDLSGVLDDATYGNNATSTVPGTLSYTSPTLEWSGALPAGSSVEVDYSVTLKAGGNGTVTNVAWVPNDPSSPGAPPACTVGTGVDPATGEPCSVTTGRIGSYTVSKTASATTVHPGDKITYTVTVTNTGNADYTAAAPASFSDDLSGVLDDANYDGDASGGASVSGSTLSWSGALPVGTSTSITYSATVKSPDTGNHVLNNSVSATSPGGLCDAAASCTTTTPVASFAVTKTTTATAVTPGAVVPYTITVTNTGQSAYTAGNPASFTDNLSAVLDDAAFNGDLVSSSGSGASFGGGVVSWSGPLAVGASVTVTYSVTVDNPDAGDKKLQNTVVTPSGIGGDCVSGAPDPACTANVPATSFTVSKTASSTSAAPGNTVTYAVTVTNTGAVAFTATNPASFTDDLSGVLDDATYNGDVSAGGSVSGDTLTWSGALPVNGTVTVTYSVTVKSPDTGDHLLTNAVTPTAPGGECDPTGVCTTGTPIAGYTVAKTASVSSAALGSTVTYTVTVSNSGQVAYTALNPASFSDDLSAVLDDATYNRDVSAGGVVAGNTLTWSGPLAVGGTAQVTYSVTVNTPDTGDHQLTNSVVPSGPGGVCGAAGLCTTHTSVASYTVAKSASTAGALPGSTVTYSVAVKNTGTTAYTTAVPASFSDDLSAVLDDATYDGDVSAGGVVSGNTLTWSGALVVGATVQVTYSVTVDNPDVGDHQLTNVVTPTASGGECATVGSCTTTTPIGSYSVSKAASATTTTPGSTVTYTVVVANTGQVAYPAGQPASFTDDLSGVLDDASYNGDVSAGGSLSGNTLSWSGPLAVGATDTVTYSVTVDDPDTGDHALTNTVDPGGPGGECATQTACATDTPVASFTAVKSTTATAVTPGEIVPYTVTITNTGQVAYTVANPASFTDDLSSVLDDASYNGDVASSAGSGASYAAPEISWSGALGVGATVTVTYSVTVNTPDAGDHKLDNVVVTPAGTGGSCPPNSVDPSCAANVPSGSFTVAKTASATSADPGATITYTVTVVNTGATAYTATNPASFSDDLSRVLDDASYDGDASAGASVNGNVLAWSGTLAVGASTTVTYSVTVNSPDTGDHAIINVVAPTAPGGACDPAGSCTTSTPVAGFTVAKSADVTQADPGQKVTYTVSVVNVGGVDYTASDPASFADDLSAVLDDATYDADASAGASFSGHTLAWSGALSVGATATVTYSVTVNTPDAGDHELDNTVDPTAPGGVCDPVGSCATHDPVRSYTAAKSVSSTAAKPGSTLTYTITVTNTGAAAYTVASPASFTDDLSSALKVASYNGDATAGTSYAAPILSWAGPLAVGAAATITYSVHVNSGASGTIDNVVVTPAAAGSNCASGSIDPACRTSTVITPLPPIVLALTGTNVLFPIGLALLFALTGLVFFAVARLRRRGRAS